MLITTLNRGLGRNLTRRSINQNILEHRRFASKSDLIVVLDMDECLIHSQFLSMKDDLYRQKEARPDKISTKTIESFRITLPDGDIVQVNKRPHLDEFLQKVSSRFETHIFTAAMEVYARPVLDKLDPHGTIFSKRFYRNFCTQNTELGCYVKDLEEIRNHEEKTSPLLLSKVSDFRRMVCIYRQLLNLIFLKNLIFYISIQGLSG